MLLMLGMALAADPNLEPVTTVLTDLTEQTGGTVLVGTAGPEAAKALEKLQETDAKLPVKVVSVPLLGDAEAEMKKVLDAAALTCGVRVGLVDGAWACSTHGACDEAAEPAPPPPASVGGLSPEARAAALATYRDTALARVKPAERITTNPMVNGSASTSIPWRVYDGKGEALGARDFATALGDTTTLDELEQDAAAARKRRAALAVLGPVALGAGVALTLGVQPFDLMVSPVGTEAHHGQALTQDLLTVGASAMMAGGASALALAFVQVPLADVRASKVHKYYSSSEADARIEKYNLETLFHLGLRPEDLAEPPKAP